MTHSAHNGKTLFFSEFIDDFYAECDEHLAIIRRGLLALEPWIGQPVGDQELLNTLFRSFHTLKGLAGMVGAAEVEALAHEVETYLRALQQHAPPLAPAAYECLVDTVGALEQLLAALKQDQPLDSEVAVLADLRRLNAAAPPPTPPAAAPADPGPGEPLWRFTFQPTPALAERGLTVNVVRERLQALGQLRDSTPRVLGAGAIAFDFLVATVADEAVFAAWAEDGISAEPVQAAPAPPAPTRGSPAQATPISGSPAATLSPLIRVDIARLDGLMDLVGGLVTNRARLGDQLRGLEALLPVAEWRGVQETNLLLERQLRGLRAAVMRLRLVPIGELIGRMQFVVRDLARESGKQVRFELSGQNIEIDKYVIERIADPLLHLVRNAVSHGIEAPAERVRLGKDPEGWLALRVAAAGDVVVIELQDDGAGIDVGRVVSRARDLGIPGLDESIDSQQVLDLITLPGFSTRDTADRASGRGVGMDVVRTTVAELGGQLALESARDRGTLFRLVLPLTLSIVDALVVALGDQRFALPLPAVGEIIEVPAAALATLEHAGVLEYRGGILPLLDLAALFGAAPAAGRHYALVIGQEPNRVGALVHGLLGKREIVVRPLADPLAQVAGCMGVTDLGDGRATLILDGPGLSQLARSRHQPAPRRQPAAHQGRNPAVNTSQSGSDHFIIFELAGSAYAVHSRDVQLIDMIDQITPLPNAAPAIEGLVLSRGDIVPAISLRAQFGFPRVGHDLRTRLLIINYAGRKVALIVDTAREFLRIPAESVTPPSDAIGGIGARYLEGIARLENRLVLIVNLDALFDLADVSATLATL